MPLGWLGHIKALAALPKTTDGKQGGSRYRRGVLQRNTDPVRAAGLRKVLFGVQPDPALKELNTKPAAISSGY